MTTPPHRPTLPPTKVAHVALSQGGVRMELEKFLKKMFAEIQSARLNYDAPHPTGSESDGRSYAQQSVGCRVRHADQTTLTFVTLSARLRFNDKKFLAYELVLTARPCDEYFNIDEFEPVNQGSLVMEFNSAQILELLERGGAREMTALTLLGIQHKARAYQSGDFSQWLESVRNAPLQLGMAA